MTVYIQPRVLNPFRDVSAEELAEYRGWACENCGHGVGDDPERNHCIVPDRKRYHQQVSIALNYELVCHWCHQREDVHTFQHRVEFKRKQEERYGAEVVAGWLRS